MHPLTISAKDQNLLSAFPRPPPGLPSPSKSLPLSPSPVRAADFGFIPVGSRDDDSDSLYDFPEEPYYGDVELRSKPTAAMNSGQFQLVLDHPSRVFAPNDVVTGYILGWEPPSPHISITLQGHVETWMRRDKTEYQACTPVLHHVTQLTLDQSNSIPQFSVTIPTRVTAGLFQREKYAPTASNNPWTHNWPSQPPFEHEPNHPLPPSLNTPHLTSTTLATSYAEAFCRISYTLVATRSSSPHNSSTAISSPTIPLTLSTLHLPHSKLTLLRSQSQTLSTDLSIRTLHLLKPPPLPNPSTAPKHPTPKLSLRSAFLDAFTTSSPAFHFRAFVCLPQVVTPGADLPLTIRLEVLPPPPGESSTFAVPDVHIKRGRVRVVAWTGVRCAPPPPPSTSLHAPGSRPRLGRRALCSCLKDKDAEPNPPSSSHTPPSHTFKHTILRTSFILPSSPSSSSHTFTPLDGAFAHQKCVITNVTFPSENTGKDGAGAAPCFTTWTAWRSYEVKVEVVFEVVGREVCGRWRAGVDVVRGDV